MPPRRGKAFNGPVAAQRPRKRTAHDLCEGCGHFRSAHRLSQECRHDGCPCQEMGWTLPAPGRRSQTPAKITDEVKLQMESLLKSGMNYRKVGAAVGCAAETVRKHFPGYGDNGRADVAAHREIIKYYDDRRIQRDKLIKERKNDHR